MLFTTLKFQVAYPPYKEREPHYNYAPSNEDWEKVKKICPFLEPTDVCEENIEKVKTSLQMLYDEYVEMTKEEAGTDASGEEDGGCNPSSSHGSTSSVVAEFDQIISIVRKNEAVPPSKFELQTYLEEWCKHFLVLWSGGKIIP
ncbi:hypothetical protein C2S51_031428 [Perilla frutescens var. frutescens]|nr:hypothetical protein C2S51_031428 [Perilla frutescens var. frutescens]